jgi:hypothetical protein
MLGLAAVYLLYGIWIGNLGCTLVLGPDVFIHVGYGLADFILELELRGIYLYVEQGTAEFGTST